VASLSFIQLAGPAALGVRLLAAATLSLGILVWLVLVSEVALTGGPDGIQVPRLVLFRRRVAGAETWYWITGRIVGRGVLVALDRMTAERT
jgi:branched-chain amino acid transport system permease protein